MDQLLPPAPGGPLHCCSNSLLLSPSLRFLILFLALLFLSAFLFCSQTCLCFYVCVSHVTFFLFSYVFVKCWDSCGQGSGYRVFRIGTHVRCVCVCVCVLLPFYPISPRNSELQGLSSTLCALCIGESLLQQLCGVWQLGPGPCFTG